MITKQQVEDLGFVFKQKLINNQIDFINNEIGTVISLSVEGKVDIICENYKKSWSNIDSIDDIKKNIELITNQSKGEAS